MDNFTFHNPTQLVFGKNTIPQIGPMIARDGHKKVLLLAGSGSIKANGVYAQTVKSLADAGVQFAEAWGVQPNPVLTKAQEAMAAVRAASATAILAVGGGSVLDTAKAVAAGIRAGDIWSCYEAKKPITDAMPVYCVLTLSATGSEMNGNSVLTNEAEKKKWHIFGPAIYPKVSIIDPQAQMSLPWSQTVNGTVDAMAHTLEFYLSTTDQETTMALDESLLRTLARVTDRLQANPADYPARADLAWAATLALNGISGACTAGGDWATHGMEHSISAIRSDIAHGTGLGILFPAWILYCQSGNPATFSRWAREVWGAASVEAGVEAFRAKLRQWKAPTRLSELGVSRQQMAEMVANTKMAGPLGSVRRLGTQDVAQIFELAF